MKRNQRKKRSSFLLAFIAVVICIVLGAVLAFNIDNGNTSDKSSSSDTSTSSSSSENESSSSSSESSSEEESSSEAENESSESSSEEQSEPSSSEEQESSSEQEEQTEELSPSGKPYSYYETVEPTYVDGVLLVNKTYALPSSYGGSNDEANYALGNLQTAAGEAGYSMPLISGYRSFDKQDGLYRNYAARDGKQMADTYSAWPGHSEHQTGLAFDIGALDDNFGETAAGKWLAENAHKYGFIIRYPKGKESITGYQYEPWHVRYLGIETATAVYESGLCLEEYLGV